VHPLPARTSGAAGGDPEGSPPFPYFERLNHQAKTIKQETAMKKRHTLIVLMLIAIAVIVGYGWFTATRPAAATRTAERPVALATIEVASGEQDPQGGKGLVGGVLWWP
jgi:hypothetical protein